MRLNYDDKSLIIRFLQQRIKELYNSRIFITGDYYKQFEMNYGMAHFIAKYLNYTYPVLDTVTKQEYAQINSQTPKRQITECISLMNYFLCDNKGNRLTFNENYMSNPHQEEGSPRYVPYITQGSELQPDLSSNKDYNKIYNDYMKVVNLKQQDSSSVVQPLYSSFVVDNDLPLFTSSTVDTVTNKTVYHINKNIIFCLEPWNVEKNICEIDDFVASYLLGRTITPKSSMEDIYYAQKLLYQNQEITKERKGVWCLPGEEGTIYDMTTVIMNYQKTRVNKLSTTPLFVTGYFDIFTEAAILKDVGEQDNGIYGL